MDTNTNAKLVRSGKLFINPDNVRFALTDMSLEDGSRGVQLYFNGSEAPVELGGDLANAAEDILFGSAHDVTPQTQTQSTVIK